jgi:hypothetical protein
MLLMTIVFPVFLAMAAHAEEHSEKVPVKDGFQKLDMQGFDGAMAADAKVQKAKTKTSVGCTNATGQSFKQTDAGYENCMMQLKPLNEKDKGSTTNIQFGN